MTTTRRNFLTLLGLAPIAVKIAPAPAVAPVHPTYGMVADRSGRMLIGKLTNADGSMIFDFDNGRIVIRGDMICNGSVVAVKRQSTLDDWDEEYGW